MKILAFAGSNSSTSINKQFATYTAKQFKNAEVQIIDLNDYKLPLFGVDLEKEIGKHPEAQRFLDHIAAADFLVISLAEHNGNYSVAFKNIFDWASRIEKNVFQEKPTLLMATSNGARGGRSVLDIGLSNLVRYGMVISASFSLPKFSENFNSTTQELNPGEYKEELLKIIGELNQ